MFRSTQRLRNVLAATAVAVPILLGSYSPASAHDWSGWHYVSGGGLTNLPLAATAFENKLYLFAVGLNNGIFVQTYDGSAWNGSWVELPGDGRTDAAVAATTGNDHLYLFCKGLAPDNRVWMNTKAYLGGWTGWRPLPSSVVTTDVAPAAATTFYGEVMVFVKRASDKVVYASQRLAGDTLWSAFSPLKGITTNVSPAAVWDLIAGRLLLFAPQSSNNAICVNAYDRFAGTWTGWSLKPGGGATDAALTAAWDDSPVGVTGTHLFAKGLNPDDRPWLETYDGSAWSAWSVLDGLSDVAYAVTTYQSNLYLFAKGIKPDQQIYVNIGQ